jgi:hypothetical protein
MGQLYQNWIGACQLCGTVTVYKSKIELPPDQRHGDCGDRRSCPQGVAVPVPSYYQDIMIKLAVNGLKTPQAELALIEVVKQDRPRFDDGRGFTELFELILPVMESAKRVGGIDAANQVFGEWVTEWIAQGS